MIRRALALALSLSLAACTAPGATTQRVETFLGGADAVRLIRGDGAARDVRAWRIDGMAHMEGRADGAAGTLHGYPVLAGPVTVDDASAATVVDVLTSDDTYLWDEAKACEFLPGVALRFGDGAGAVDVLICFSCDELEVWSGGRKTGHEDFDPRRPDLVRVAQAAFPDDDRIRTLR